MLLSLEEKLAALTPNSDWRGGSRLACCIVAALRCFITGHRRVPRQARPIGGIGGHLSVPPGLSWVALNACVSYSQATSGCFGGSPTPNASPGSQAVKDTTRWRPSHDAAARISRLQGREREWGPENLCLLERGQVARGHGLSGSFTACGFLPFPPEALPHT